MTAVAALEGPADRAAIYAGRIHHRREGPQAHRFALNVFSVLLDLDDLPELARRSRLFRYNRLGLLSFHDRDHGRRDGSPLRPWVAAQLDAAGLAPFARRISILCFPRILGHVFNPLSVYFCRDREDRLGAILYEVKNTFGGQHAYLVAIDPDDGATPVLAHRQAKAFHVSPFLGAGGGYRFRMRPPGLRYSLSIRFDDDEGNRLTAVHTACRQPWAEGVLLRHLIRFPLQPIMVIGGIHRHALALWRKGARFHRAPPGDRIRPAVHKP